MPEENIDLRDDAAVVAAWKAALALGRRTGLSLFKQACLSGAVLELARQAAGRGGSCALQETSDGGALRVRVVVDGCSAELLAGGRGRLNREINVGPALPAVKLHQVVEELSAEPSAAGVRVTLTIFQPRLARSPARHPVAALAGRRR